MGDSGVKPDILLATQEHPQRFLSAVLTTVPAFIARITSTYSIRYVNRAQPGTSVNDAIGANFLDYLSLDDRVKAQRRFDSVQRKRKSESFEVSSLRVAPNGSHHRIYVSPIIDPNESVGLCVVAVDITKEHELEEQVRRSQRLRAIGELTAGIAHNFNNMLMVVMPSLEMLEDAVPESHADLMSDIKEATTRSVEMVRQLMIYAGQKLPAERAPCSVVDITRQVVELCRQTFPAASWVVELDEDIPPIQANANEILQVLMNIVMNARDALLERSAPRIEVRVDTLDDCCRIRISDNGTGIEPDALERIFEPFYTTKQNTGTGLGLATSFAIVRDHGGKLVCESQVGAGTAFEILLPLNERDAPSYPAPPSSP